MTARSIDRMHVLVALVERELAVGDLGADGRERGLERLRLVGVEQPGVLERADVRDRRLDVLVGQAHVEPQGATERVRLGRGRVA